MKIEIELDEAEVQRQVVEKLARGLEYEAGNTMRMMVKDVIVSEIRSTIKQHVNEILRTTTLQDGRTFKQYVADCVAGVKTSDWSRRERLGIESLIQTTVAERAREWYHEMVGAKMPEIKEKIREEITKKLMSELT